MLMSSSSHYQPHSQTLPTSEVEVDVPAVPVLRQIYEGVDPGMDSSRHRQLLGRQHQGLGAVHTDMAAVVARQLLRRHTDPLTFHVQHRSTLYDNLNEGQ